VVVWRRLQSPAYCPAAAAPQESACGAASC
jgi:hypothetical protein